MNSLAEIVKRSISRNKLLFGLLVLVALLSVVASLLPAQVLRVIVDTYLIGESSNPIIGIALLYFGVIAFSCVLDICKEACLVIFGNRMIQDIRNSMIRKLIHLPYNYFSKNVSGKIVSYFNNDVDAIQSLFSNGIISMVIDALKVVGILVSIALFSMQLFLIVVITLPIIIIITRSFQKRVLKAQIENRKCIAAVNNFIPETVDNLEMINTCEAKTYMEQNYINRIQEQYNVVEKINFFDSIFSPIILVIKTIVICAVVILASPQLSLLGISVGAVAASISLIGDIFKPIESLGMELQNIQQSMAGIKRVDEFLNEQEDTLKEDIKAQELDACLMDGSIVFDSVDFGYDENRKILNNFNLQIDARQKVTLTGRTGSGKSTCFKLVLGLLTPNSGTVSLCQTEMSKIPNSEKRHIFGYVEQSFNEVDGTIKDQITLHDESISDTQVLEALENVGLKEHILKLENGINTKMDPTVFSFGQRQLLSIARAIVTKPPILLLDEMSANLDVETEKQVLSVLQKVSTNCTVLSISHRYSSILQDNRIIDITK